MNTKKGMLFVVLLVLIIFAVGVLADGGFKKNDQKNHVIGKKVNGGRPYYYCEYDIDETWDCWYDEAGLYDYENVESLEDNERLGIILDGGVPDIGGSCLDSTVFNIPTGAQNGCRVIIVDRDSGDPNDGANAYLTYGEIINQDWRFLDEPKPLLSENYCDSNDAKEALHYAKFRAPDKKTFICSNNKYWHTCIDDSKEKDKEEKDKIYGSYVAVNNKAYNCSEWDYSANPTKPTKTEIVTWRELPGEDKDSDGVTDKLGDCQDDPTTDPAICLEREDPLDCSSKYAACASCIHPGATEVCGDGIDNSCRTGAKDQAVLDANDDCDLKTYQTECKVDFDSLPDPQSGGEVNLCCGDDGIKDLGEKIKGKSGNYLCLNKEEKLTSLGNGNAIDTIEADKWSGLNGTWKWVRASGDAKFTIYTIKKPGELVYDVASSGEDWQQCSTSNEGKMASQFDPENGDKFYCYASGDQWSWAECCSKEGTCQNKDSNGVKIRKAGEGVFNLMRFLKVDENTAKSSIPFGQPGGFFSSEGTTVYENIYGQNYLSFTGYDYLDVYFDFSGDTIEAGTTLQMEVWSTSGKIASENVLSSVINGAALQTKKVYHAQIPVSGWRDITLITFKTTPTTVPLEIKNVQVVKKDTNPVCSGSNTWLNDIDEKDEAIEEGKMCKDLGLTWLGNDAVNRCCGDDQKEYGVGSKGGCWNSQGIMLGQTTNDVNVELTYGKGEWEYDSTPVEVSTSVELKASKIELSLLTNIAGVKCEDMGSFKICYTDKASVKPQDLSLVGGNLVKSVVDSGTFGIPVPGTFDVSSIPTIPSFIDLKSNGYTCQFLESYTFCYDNLIDLKDKLFYLKDNQIYVKSFTILTTPTSHSGKVATAALTRIGDPIIFTKTDFIEASLKDSKGGKIFFFDPLKDDQNNYDDEKTTIKYEDLIEEKTTYYIMAKADTLKQSYTYNPSTTETLTYSCTTSPCTFPLKGSPPYRIKNVYPAKYDLYFVNVVDGRETRTFINPEKTIYATSGWLEAVNVPQQVVFNGTIFLGCGDTTALGTAPLTNEKMCFSQKTTTDGFYCAPDYGWKKDSLPVMVYDNDNKLQLLTPEVLLKSEERNHTSSIVFGRNILVNPMLDLTK